MSAAARLLLAAPRSGEGKTTVTMALLRALQEAGRRPTAFKCGPDYIDPMFHRRVLGLPCQNLDLFLSDEDGVRGVLARGSAQGDIAVIEAAMGYYDGIGVTERASAWQVACETATPTLLILSAKGAAATLAAVACGLRDYAGPGRSQLAGLLLNGCGAAHYARLAPMLTQKTGLPVLGYLPALPDCALPARHLGLVTAQELQNWAQIVATLGQTAQRTMDIPRILQLAQGAPPLLDATQNIPQKQSPQSDGPILAVAKDAAFCFYYDETLALLEALGARLRFFSPLEDAALPNGAAALYLGGGYPELYAAQLAQNAPMRAEVAAAVQGGMPCLAECGGFLYLHETLCDPQGTPHPMAGVIAATAQRGEGLSRFGYVTMTARQDNLLCNAGDTLRAHEFHYWQSSDPGAGLCAQKPDGRSWATGHLQKTLFAGFGHLYLPGCLKAAGRFVAAARSYAAQNNADGEAS